MALHRLACYLLEAHARLKRALKWFRCAFKRVGQQGRSKIETRRERVHMHPHPSPFSRELFWPRDLLLTEGLPWKMLRQGVAAC